MRVEARIEAMAAALREARAIAGNAVKLIEHEMGPEGAARWSRRDPMATLSEVYGPYLGTLIQALDRGIKAAGE